MCGEREICVADNRGPCLANTTRDGSRIECPQHECGKRILENSTDNKVFRCRLVIGSFFRSLIGGSTVAKYAVNQSEHKYFSRPIRSGTTSTPAVNLVMHVFPRFEQVASTYPPRTGYKNSRAWPAVVQGLYGFPPLQTVVTFCDIFWVAVIFSFKTAIIKPRQFQ